MCFCIVGGCCFDFFSRGVVFGFIRYDENFLVGVVYVVFYNGCKYCFELVDFIGYVGGNSFCFDFDVIGVKLIDDVFSGDVVIFCYCGDEDFGEVIDYCLDLCVVLICVWIWLFFGGLRGDELDVVYFVLFFCCCFVFYFENNFDGVKNGEFGDYYFVCGGCYLIFVGCCYVGDVSGDWFDFVGFIDCGGEFIVFVGFFIWRVDGKYD